MKISFHLFLLAILALIACDSSRFTSGGKVIKARDLGGEPGATATPEPEPEPEPIDLSLPNILDKKKVTKETKGVSVRWRKGAGDSGIDTYEFLVFNEASQTVFSSAYPASDLPGDASVVHTATITESLPEAIYSYQVSAIAKDGLRTFSNKGELIVDQTPPKIDLFLGHYQLPQPCDEAPENILDTAVRLIPFDYCAKDQGRVQSGVEKLCFRSGRESNDQPSVDDACWKEPRNLLSLMLLYRGLNNVKAFAKDVAGNIGNNLDDINLNIALPPSIDILRPDPRTISRAWTADEEITFAWEISDDDTDYSQIKIIISFLSLAATNETDFKHLGCNFANTPIWNQCPDGAPENLEDIKVDANNGLKGRGSYKFKVPSDWNNNKHYVFSITAIDKSGNAMVASTQELNAGWEVIAGRSYKGLGGSGVTMQRSGGNSGYIAFDKQGRFYDTTSNYKINTFDYRACRLFKHPDSAPTAFDCRDTLTSAAAFTEARGYRLLRPWYYNANKDVFYTVVNANIYELDFNNGKVTALFAAAGATEISSGTAAGVSASSLRLTSVSPYMYYSADHSVLYFMHKQQLYGLDAGGNVQYMLGSEGGAKCAVEATNIAQKNLALPASHNNFAVTGDYRLIMDGDIPDPRENQPCSQGVSQGNGVAFQYVVDSFNPHDANAMVSKFIQLTSTKKRSDGWLSEVGAGFPNSGYLSSPISINEQGTRLLTSAAWWGSVYMDLPAKGSDAPAYQWRYFVTKYATGTVPREADFLPAQQPTPGGKAVFDAMPYNMIYAGQGLTYVTNTTTGSILSYDFATGKVELMIGVPYGNEPAQLGINRRLDTPRSIGIVSDSEILFNDFYALHRVTLPTQAGALSQIVTAKKGFYAGTFEYNKAGNSLYSFDTGNLSVHNLTTDVTTPMAKTDRVAAPDDPRRSNILFSGYDGIHAISRNFSVPKLFYGATVFNGVIGDTDISYLGLRQQTTQILSSPLLYNSRYCNSTHNGPCAQTASERTLGTAKYFDLNEYIVNDIRAGGSVPEYHVGTGRFEWRSYVTTAVFDQNDENVIGCFENKFALFNLPNHRLFFFTVRDSTGTAMACSSLYSHFRFFNGGIYFNNLRDGFNSDSIYRLDTTTIMTANSAVATKVATLAPMMTSAYVSFELTDKYIFYTERGYHRVLRNERP